MARPRLTHATMLAQFQAVLETHFTDSVPLDHWWPGRTGFEIVASAILVQNTAWTNAQRALEELRRAGKLSLAGVRATGDDELGALVRSSGYWRQKARCLKAFVDWLDQAHGGSLARMFAQPTHVARRQLLALRGIGEETADAILLFAGDHPVLIWDAYTRRILARHGLPTDRAWAESQAPSEAARLRRLHAVLVETAKRYCGKQLPDCSACPLGPWLRPAAAGFATPSRLRRRRAGANGGGPAAR